MKAAIKIFILSIVLNFVTWIAPQKASAQVSVSFQVFYDDLSPYGDWVDNSDYGYVWIPNVSSGFTPYSTNGYWIITDAGWTWISNYSWGWAPFHYGRWHYDPYYGWLWVPDSEWGPGWVTWRRSQGYYGWAPIGPGISIDFAYSNGYSLPYNEWTFVRDRDFGRTNINNYYISSSNNITIFNNSTVINNIYADRSSNVRYNTGPDRNEVERSVGKTFTPVVIKENNRHGQNLSNDQLQIYRPQVQKNISADRRPAPSKVSDMKDVQPVRQRNTDMSQPQKENQINKGRPSQRQNVDQPLKQEPVRQQRNDQPIQQDPSRQRRNDQPVKQDQPQQKRNDQPVKQDQPQQKRNDQPVKQDQPQQKRNDPPPKQQPSQPQHSNPVKKVKGQSNGNITINKEEVSGSDTESYNSLTCFMNTFILVK